ncbi:MAG: exodeoxyribonuclease VII large subunit [Holosporales bacterium]|nr:exodeoxyribonuclease VII large subunit [Holosporales bacterium]
MKRLYLPMPQSLSLEKTIHILGDEKVLSVSELSGMIKSTVEKSFTSLRVQGEISGLKLHSSGHTYFSLKDDDSVINAICWRGTHLSFPLEDGAQIIVKGRVTTYSVKSQYQIIVEEANIAGEGALLKILNERRKKFHEMGYFDKKRPIPKYPRIIGIITSKTGSVLQDMQHRLRDRYPICKIIVWSVNVQGNEAASQVAEAVRGFNIMVDERPDVLIVARGGGSVEDLWPFNEEIVIKAVYDSNIPVISAIGHETDTTLIDYASDLRAPTPTAAIELCTPVLSDVNLQIIQYCERMTMSMLRILREHENKIDNFAKSISASKFFIINLSQRFDEMSDRFVKSFETYFNLESLKLQKQKIISLENYIALKKQTCSSASSVFDKLMKVYLNRYFELITILSGRLEQGSYKKILEKGFCFITDTKGGAIKTKVEFENKGDEQMLLNFVDGTASIKQS